VTTNVSEVRESSSDVLDALNQLLPQLSSNASVLTKDDLDIIVQSSSTTLLVAKVDNEIVGSLTLVCFAIPTGVRAWIEDVVVDQAFQGRGVGESLTTRAVAIARECGAQSVDLTSRPSRDAANRLYQRLGFSRRDTNVYRLSL